MHAPASPLRARRPSFEILKTPPATAAIERAPCPKCAHENPLADELCARCGVVFAKVLYRRRQIEAAQAALREAPPWPDEVTAPRRRVVGTAATRPRAALAVALAAVVVAGVAALLL